MTVVFLFILCYSIFCCGCMFAFVGLDLVFQYSVERLAEKNVSKMTYFVLRGTS